MTKLVSNALCLAVLAGVGLALPGLAKAAPTCGPKRILIVYADTATPDQLRAALLAEPGVATVDYFDAHAGTPTASQLAPYNLVLAFSNSSYADGTSLGNVLADYEDQGAGLVQQLSFSYRGPDQPYGLNGRWVTGNYAPFTYSTALLTNPAVLGTYDASDPLMAGVTALSTNSRLGISAASGSTVVASWNDAVPAVAVRRNGVIGINAYLGAGATWSGQFGHLIVNGFNLFCVTPLPPPPPPPPPPAPKCKVPRVIGLTVAKANAKLKRAHCKVGTIRRAHSRKVGRVIRQSPRPGLTKPNGFKVKLLVGRR